MGEDNKINLGSVFIKNEDGTIQELKGITSIKAENEKENNELNYIKDAVIKMKQSNLAFTDITSKEITINISKESSITMQKMLGINKISKKRFIKLLMGCRIQRNDAIEFARIVKKCGFSYSPIMVQAVIEWCLKQMWEKEEKNENTKDY